MHTVCARACVLYMCVLLCVVCAGVRCAYCVLHVLCVLHVACGVCAGSDVCMCMWHDEVCMLFVSWVSGRGHGVPPRGEFLLMIRRLCGALLEDSSAPAGHSRTHRSICVFK